MKPLPAAGVRCWGSETLSYSLGSTTNLPLDLKQFVSSPRKEKDSDFPVESHFQFCLSLEKQVFQVRGGGMLEKDGPILMENEKLGHFIWHLSWRRGILMGQEVIIKPCVIDPRLLCRPTL